MVRHPASTPQIVIQFLFNTNLVVALEGLEVVESVDRRGVSDPLQRLPVGNDPYIGHPVDEVQEHDETFFVVRLGEPCSVIEETEWSPGN